MRDENHRWNSKSWERLQTCETESQTEYIDVPSKTFGNARHFDVLTKCSVPLGSSGKTSILLWTAIMLEKCIYATHAFIRRSQAQCRKCCHSPHMNRAAQPSPMAKHPRHEQLQSHIEVRIDSRI